MSHSPGEPDPKPRACSVHSVSTAGGDEATRKMRKASRAKHSWEYVPVDPAEEELPPPSASRLQKELFSSFNPNFLGGAGRRTRAAAVNASQHFHDHSGSEASHSSHSHPASESAFSTATTNTQASPASSPAPPSAPNAIRKRKDSAAPTTDANKKNPKSSTPATPATSAPASTSAAATAPVTAPASVPASSPQPSRAPAVQRAQSVQHDDRSSAWSSSRATNTPAKESGKQKPAVFDDATNKTKTASKKTDAKPSPAPEPLIESRKRKSSPAAAAAAEKMAPKMKKAKTAGGTATDLQHKTAKAQALQKRDSLLQQDDIYAQVLPWSGKISPAQPTPPQKTNSPHVQQPAKGKTHHKQQNRISSSSSSSIYPPTRAQLAEQLEEITHRGIAGGPANYSSLREYRAACAAEAAWQERDQEVVERMLDNPNVIAALKRLRVLNVEIEAERKASKGSGLGKGHGKGGRRKKVSDGLMDGD